VTAKKPGAARFAVALLSTLTVALVDAWLIMAFLSVVHDDAPAVPALGYGASLAVVFLARILRRDGDGRTAGDILRAARAVIADPAHWTQGVLARDAAGLKCQPNDPAAVCWCSVGALRRADDDSEAGYEAGNILDDIADLATGGLGVTAEWNDTATSHAQILAGFDEAIALADTPDRLAAK